MDTGPVTPTTWADTQGLAVARKRSFVLQTFPFDRVYGHGILRCPAFSGQGFPLALRCQVLPDPFLLDLVRSYIPERRMEPDLVVP